MARPKKTAEAVKREVDQLKEQIAALEEQAREQGLAFSSLNEEQLTKKVRGETSKSPFIYAQSWTSGTTPGSTANYTVHVHNPDPTTYYPFYATIFFGLGNFFSVEQGWIGRDKRWPAFSSVQEWFSSLQNRSFFFPYTVPLGLPLGTYNGNSVVWRADYRTQHDPDEPHPWLGPAAVFDRGSFDVKLW